MSPTGTARTVICVLTTLTRQGLATPLFITRGESLAYVKDQLGHSSISMTVDTYGNLVPGANRAAMDRLPTVEDLPEAGTKRERNSRFHAHS